MSVGNTLVMTSIYGPKQCSVSNVEYSELANITVKITYMEEKESTGWRGVRRRQRPDEYELRGAKAFGERNQALSLPPQRDLRIRASGLRRRFHIPFSFPAAS